MFCMHMAYCSCREGLKIKRRKKNKRKTVMHAHGLVTLKELVKWKKKKKEFITRKKNMHV